MFFNRNRNNKSKPLPDGYYPVSTWRELLLPYQPVLQEIRSIIGIDDQYWNALYQPIIERYAAWIQQLPASEYHHHSAPGGLLTHGLDVAVRALRARRGYILPRGASPERAAREDQVWTYTIFTAALLHDLGKPLTDQIVTIYDHRLTAIGQWNPWAGPMTGAAYTVRYYRNRDNRRDYTLHQAAASLVVPRIIPKVGLQWITDNREAFSGWLALLTGQEAGLVEDIVKKADKDSVAEDLGGAYAEQSGNNIGSRAAPSKNKPLAERMLISLRKLIEQETLPLNANGSAGWVVGDSVWMVWERALDKIKTDMAEEGQLGIPGKNIRLVEEFQSARIIVPTPEGKGIWAMKVFGTSWPKAHNLTMLRFPVATLWPEEGARPSQFDGELTQNNGEPPPTLDQLVAGVVSGDNVTDKGLPDEERTDQQQSGNQPEEDTDSKQKPDHHENRLTERAEPAGPSVTHDDQYAGLELPLPPLVSEGDGQAAEDEEPVDAGQQARRPVGTSSTPEDTAAAEPEQKHETAGSPNNRASKPDDEPRSAGSPSSRGEAGTVAESANEGAGTPSTYPYDHTELTGRKLGQAFLDWVRFELGSRRLPINTQHALIHRVDEGLLLISPAIFRSFANERWSEAQNGFTKLRVHERRPDGTNIHTYVVSGKKKTSKIKGFQITDVCGVFPGIELPETNVYVVHEDKAKK